MRQCWIVVAFLGCTRPTGIEVTPGDFADRRVQDAGSDAALPDGGAPEPGWHAQPSGSSQDLRGIWGSGANDVYVVGRHGIILHSRGDGEWTTQESGTMQDLHAIWGSDAHNVYAAGDVLLHSSGDGAWYEEPAPSGLMGVWGRSSADLYVAGVFGISHSSGDGKWTAENDAERWGGYFHVRGDGEQLFAVGGLINLSEPSAPGGGVAQFSAGHWTWTQLSPAHEMKDLALTTRGAFVVGLSGEIWANGSGSWVQQSSPVPWDLQGIWADSDGALYAVGGSGTVLTSSGDGHWTAQSALFALDLWGVWGTGPHDVYAVGDQGKIFHLN